MSLHRLCDFSQSSCCFCSIPPKNEGISTKFKLWTRTQKKKLWKNITSTSNIVIVGILQHSYLEKHRKLSCQDTNINDFFHKHHLNPNCGTPPRVWVMLSGWEVVRFAWLDLPGIFRSSIIQKPSDVACVSSGWLDESHVFMRSVS